MVSPGLGRLGWKSSAPSRWKGHELGQSQLPPKPTHPPQCWQQPRGWARSSPEPGAAICSDWSLLSQALYESAPPR